MADEAGARHLMTAVMEAVAEPERWPDALDSLAAFFGGVAAMAEFHTEQGRRIAIGPRNRFISEESLSLYIDHYAALCPRPNTMRQRHLPAVQTDQLVGDDKALDANPFYSELLHRDNLGDYLGLRLRLRNGAVDVVNVHRLKKDGHASDDEIAWMHELAPFLRSAFRARALLGEQSLGSDGLIGTLARLESPVVFLNSEGKLLFENGAASLLLSRAPQPDWQVLLASWRDSAGMAEDSAASVFRSPAGGWAARFLDLRGAVDPRVQGGVYVVMLWPVAGEAGRGAAARRGLTAAEMIVLANLIEGITPAEIARKQAVSIATVRTHIARLHDKYGVHRTLDLVRIALAERFTLE